MGDVVSLVERAAETIQVEEAEAMAAKMAKGLFDLNDLRTQLNQMRRMGGIGALAGMIPGIKKAQAQMAAGAADDKMLIHFDAIMGSMTPKERSEEHTSELQSLMRISYAVFCLK